MFVAIVVPPSREDKNIALAALFAVIVSTAFTYAPVLKEISSGTRIIIVTVMVSVIAALLFPATEQTAEKILKERGVEHD